MKRKNNMIEDNKTNKRTNIENELFIKSFNEYNYFINNINKYKNINNIDISINQNDKFIINLSVILNECKKLSKISIYGCKIIFDMLYRGAEAGLGFLIK